MQGEVLPTFYRCDYPDDGMRIYQNLGTCKNVTLSGSGDDYRMVVSWPDGSEDMQNHMRRVDYAYICGFLDSMSLWGLVGGRFSLVPNGASQEDCDNADRAAKGG